MCRRGSLDRMCACVSAYFNSSRRGEDGSARTTTASAADSRASILVTDGVSHEVDDIRARGRKLHFFFFFPFRSAICALARVYIRIIIVPSFLGELAAPRELYVQCDCHRPSRVVLTKTVSGSFILC